MNQKSNKPEEEKSQEESTISEKSQKKKKNVHQNTSEEKILKKYEKELKEQKKYLVSIEITIVVQEKQQDRLSQAIQPIIDNYKSFFKAYMCRLP
ncbi:MAG: hypothetical protein DRO88_05580 [Promethearchaeia archaeon]|nr:MAG: hypothetical protein DRO88_05580 [Candidatus Lokiarchaeia archaeon]